MINDNCWAMCWEKWQSRRERGRAPVKEIVVPVKFFCPFWAPNSYLDFNAGPQICRNSTHFRSQKHQNMTQNEVNFALLGPLWVSSPGKNNRLYPLLCGPGKMRDEWERQGYKREKERDFTKWYFRMLNKSSF